MNKKNHQECQKNIYKSFEIMDWYIKFMKKEYEADFVGFDDIGVVR